MVMRVFAVKRTMDDWKHLQEWLNDAQTHDRMREVDVAAGQAYVNKHRDRFLELITKSQKTWSRYSQQDIFERTLGPDDGV